MHSPSLLHRLLCKLTILTFNFANVISLFIFIAVNVRNPKSAATPDNVSHQVSITETASNFTDNKYGYMEASSDGFPSIEPITDDFKLIGPDGEEMESHQPISILESREEEPMSFVVISEDDGDDHEVDDYDSSDKSLSIDSLINSSWSIPDDTGGEGSTNAFPDQSHQT